MLRWAAGLPTGAREAGAGRRIELRPAGRSGKQGDRMEIHQTAYNRRHMEDAMHATAIHHAPSRAGFWAMPQRGIDKGWRSQWNRLVDRVSESDPLTLYKAVEEGVPAATVAILSRALGEPAPGVLDIIGLAETTYRRKAEAGEALPEVAGHRAMALVRVIAKLRQLLAESGDPEQVKDFDLEHWIGGWIKAPLPELGGATPAALLRNPEGQRVIESLLERMRGGLAA